MSNTFSSYHVSPWEPVRAYPAFRDVLGECTLFGNSLTYPYTSVVNRSCDIRS
jgi:hypothetical protein